jgi:ankyrin repeat protein
VNARGSIQETPLHYAMTNNRREAAKILLASGADVNTKDRYGRTPLHLVIANFYYGKTIRKELTKFLIANGADINASDNCNRTPLHYACSFNKICGVWKNEKEDIAKILIANGADVNIKNNYGETPLAQAIRSRHEKTAKLLREHGAIEK